MPGRRGRSEKEEEDDDDETGVEGVVGVALGGTALGLVVVGGVGALESHHNQKTILELHHTLAESLFKHKQVIP